MGGPYSQKLAKARRKRLQDEKGNGGQTQKLDKRKHLQEKGNGGQTSDARLDELMKAGAYKPESMAWRIVCIRTATASSRAIRIRRTKLLRPVKSSASLGWRVDDN